MKVKVCCPHGGPSTGRIVKRTGGSICVFVFVCLCMCMCICEAHRWQYLCVRRAPRAEALAVGGTWSDLRRPEPGKVAALQLSTGTTLGFNLKEK